MSKEKNIIKMKHRIHQLEMENTSLSIDLLEAHCLLVAVGFENGLETVEKAASEILSTEDPPQ